MKITFFIGGLNGGGAERVVCNLANYLADKRHDVLILTIAEGTSYPLSDKISRVSLSGGKDEAGGRILRKIKLFIRLKQFLKKNTTDVYVGFLPVEMCLLLHFRHVANTPIVVSERNSPGNYPPLIKKCIRHYARYADGMVFQTEDARSWYRLPQRVKASVIPNAINPDFITESYVGERDKIIVAVGRLTEQKNFGMLLRAFAELSDRCSAYRLVIYGEGGMRAALETQCMELGIADRVSLPGRVSDVREAVRSAALFVLSSNYEGMPNALMEAMAMGLPCISTDCPCGGPRFLIHQGVNGVLVPVNDVSALSKAMEQVLCDSRKASELGDNARKICEELSPDRICENWEYFIEEVKDR